jgi:uncharacterized protein
MAAAEVLAAVDPATPGKVFPMIENMQKLRASFVFRICVISLFFTAICMVAVAQKVVPELWGLRIHDDAKVLSPGTIEKLEQQLKSYEDSTSNQIAILIVSSLEGESIEDYSIRVVDKWKLGTQKKDNGVLLLVAIDDHKMRIEAGGGLEGVLTDAVCNRIIRNEMAPDFRRDDYDAGVTAAVDSIIKAIAGEYKADEEKPTSGLTIGQRIMIGIFLLIVLGLFTWISLFVEGCAGWGLYLFLIPFYAFFPWIVIGNRAGIILLIIYVIGMPIGKIIMSHTAWGKTKMKKMSSSSGGSGRSSGGSSWNFGGGNWSSGGGSSFSGGGGSFGGGGSSGSW